MLHFLKSTHIYIILYLYLINDQIVYWNSLYYVMVYKIALFGLIENIDFSSNLFFVYNFKVMLL